MMIRTCYGHSGMTNSNDTYVISASEVKSFLFVPNGSVFEI